MKRLGKHFGAMVIFVLFAAEFSSRANIINAVSLTVSDILSAVNSALPGDIVQLPAGTAILTQTISLNGVSLIGAGTNSTILIDEVPRSSNGEMIALTAVAGHLAEIANLQLKSGVTNTAINFNGAISVSGGANTSWRIDHNVFNGLYAESICTYGNAASVIDHNTFYERSIAVEDNSYLLGDSEGDQSYAAAPTYGQDSSNVLYVEDNCFSNFVGYVASVGACDGEGGARIVFRHNTVWNDCFNNHGTESGGRRRSERSFEVYGNTFTCLPSAPDYPLFGAMFLRGGAGVIFSNTCTGYNSLAGLRSYRYTTAYCGQWSPFCGANGINPWDSNAPTLYLSGVSSGPNGANYLQVAGANWTPNQWYGYTVLNTASGLFSVITSNTANTIYYLGSDSGSAAIIQSGLLTFNTGDPFQIHLVEAALDQPGRGSGDLLKDNGQDANGNLITINTRTGTASWPNEALDGIYVWANTVNGAPANLDSPYPTVKEGRDIYNNTVKPGYTPYVYPHPLVSGINYTNTGGGGTNTNGTGGTNQLLPPGGLHIIP